MSPCLQIERAPLFGSELSQRTFLKNNGVVGPHNHLNEHFSLPRSACRLERLKQFDAPHLVEVSSEENRGAERRACNACCVGNRDERVSVFVDVLCERVVEQPQLLVCHLPMFRHSNSCFLSPAKSWVLDWSGTLIRAASLRCIHNNIFVQISQYLMPQTLIE